MARNAAPRSDPRSGRARHDVIHTNGKGPRLTANSRGPLCPSKEGKLHICTPSEFLTALWGPTPHTRILVWTMSERRSHWLRDPKEADRAWDGDTYTGAASPGPTVKLEDNVRGEAKQAGAIAGLWVDVDYEDEHAHRKANLPSFVEARDFVQGVDPTLTITVRSGLGYQLWWLFKGRPVGIQVRHRARGSRVTVRTLAERTPPATRQGAGFHTRRVTCHEVLPTTAYHSVSPNPPKDTDGRREDSGRVGEGATGEMAGLIGVDWRSANGLQSPHRAPMALCGSCDARDGERIRSRELSRTGVARVCREVGSVAGWQFRRGVEWLAAGPWRE